MRRSRMETDSGNGQRGQVILRHMDRHAADCRRVPVFPFLGAPPNGPAQRPQDEGRARSGSRPQADPGGERGTRSTKDKGRRTKNESAKGEGSRTCRPGRSITIGPRISSRAATARDSMCGTASPAAATIVDTNRRLTGSRDTIPNMAGEVAGDRYGFPRSPGHGRRARANPQSSLHRRKVGGGDVGEGEGRLGLEQNHRSADVKSAGATGGL